MIDIVIGEPARRAAARRPPDCLKCAFYNVSWDVHFPHVCQVFALKSKNLPSFEVFHATGHHCPSFQLKAGLK